MSFKETTLQIITDSDEKENEILDELINSIPKHIEEYTTIPLPDMGMEPYFCVILNHKGHWIRKMWSPDWSMKETIYAYDMLLRHQSEIDTDINECPNLFGEETMEVCC